MKFLSSIFIALLLWLGWASVTTAQERPANTLPGSGGSGGTGGVVSNEVKTAVITTFYTNTTGHQLIGAARLGTSTAGLIQVSVTNANNTLFFQYQAMVSTAGASSNTISFSVPPGGWYKFIGLTTTATDGSQALTYYATNGAVSHAASSDSATSAGTATTAQNLTTGVSIQRANGQLLGGYPNLTNAILNATAGDTVKVPSGTYFIPTNTSLIKANVHIAFDQGAYVYQTNMGRGYTMFDFTSLGSTASTNYITGRPDLFWSQGAVSNSGMSMFRITNVNHKLVAKLGYVSGESYADDGEYPYLFDVARGNADIEFDEMQPANRETSGNTIGGIWWHDAGDMYVRNFSRIGSFPGYSIWCDDNATGNTNNFWLTGQEITGYIYTTGTTNWRSWFIVNELRRDSFGGVKSALGLFGGRTYVIAGKISAPTVPGSVEATIQVTQGAEAWIYTQKGDRNGYAPAFLNVDATSMAVLQCPQLVDSTTNSGAMIVNKGTLVLRDTSYYGLAPLLEVNRTSAATRTDVAGVVADTSGGTNAVIIANDTNTVFLGSFKSAGTTNPIVSLSVATNHSAVPSGYFCALIRTNFSSSYTLVPDVPRVITNWNFAVTSQGFTNNPATGRIGVFVPGYYEARAWIGLGADSATSAGYNLGIYTNGVLSAWYLLGTYDAYYSTDVATAGDQRKMFYEQTIYIPGGGTTVEVRLVSDTEVAPNIYNGQFSLRKL